MKLSTCIRLLVAGIMLAACGGDASQPGPDGGGNTCDAVAQTGCASNAACYLDLGTAVPSPAFCATPGLSPEAADCTIDTDCMRGTFCLHYAGLARCTQYCDATTICPSDSPSCLGLGDGPVGFCACNHPPDTGIGTCTP